MSILCMDWAILDRIAKCVSILGFITLVITVSRFFLDSAKRNRDRKIEDFKRIYEKTSYAKPSSTKRCFEEYRSHFSEEDRAASRCALLRKKEWDYYDDPKKPLLPLDQVEVDFEKVDRIVTERIESDFFPDKKNYVEELFSYGLAPKYFYNGDSYSAAKVEERDGKPYIGVYPSKYFAFYNTCKVKEFLCEAGVNLYEEDILDLETRSCGIGVNTLTILRFGEGDDALCFLMHRRGDRVAEGVGAVHVVPAGS